ncbi:hypothetical protein DVH24_035451 [Malus domestica]|uniref:Uncharacterized protein n=1 Tax=Malus domestica TaxID=3750 RepID=A0A498J7N5_MALDO|nr:hypothetical protein DVH24_035451 [Malus domestica]
MASDRPSHGSVDSGPACGLAWAGCQPIRLGWSKKRREWSIFQAGCQPIRCVCCTGLYWTGLASEAKLDWLRLD